MNLLIRLLWLVATARWRKRIELLETCHLSLRVLPNDIDLNLHLTNSRYLSLMDLGRLEYLMQTGISTKLLKLGWLPVVANVNMQFKREIKPFQRFQVNTRLIGWDEKWIFMEQRFETEEGTACIGILKALFRSKKGKVPTSEILALTGYKGDSPELPDEILHMTASNTQTVSSNAPTL